MISRLREKRKLDDLAKRMNLLHRSFNASKFDERITELRVALEGGQIDKAIALAEPLMEEYKDDGESADSLFVQLFYFIALDLAGEREAAVRGYQKILELEEIPPIMSSGKMGIQWCCREFLEYLAETPYSFEGVKEFKFPPRQRNFEFPLQKLLPVKKTAHFNIYYYPNSFAAKNIEKIAAQREQAYAEISSLLGVSVDICVTLYLFQNGRTKKKITGHQGWGWAYGHTMVEIYNRTQKCDPYHELVHVLAGEVHGNALSFFNEGFAVYVCSQLYKDNARKKVLKFHQKNQLFTLEEMFSLNIGEAVSKPPISYPQAGEMIKYLYETLGRERFFELYKALEPDTSKEGAAANIRKLEEHCQNTVGHINQAWLSTLA